MPGLPLRSAENNSTSSISQPVYPSRQSQSVAYLPRFPPKSTKSLAVSPPLSRKSSRSKSSLSVDSTPVLGKPLRSPREPPATASFAPTGSNRVLSNGSQHSASVPSLPLHTLPHSSSTALNRSFSHDAYDPIAASLPQPVLADLLRSYACRAQLQLLTSLQDIATRLVLVPKVARVSALRAELTILNHTLPRGCCLCVFCHGQSKKVDPKDVKLSKTQMHHRTTFRPHHRIIRISPSESVVLNSADRAPFLMHVEILQDDLDFDANRRQNAEDLRNILDERERSIAKASYQYGNGRTFHNASSSRPNGAGQISHLNGEAEPTSRAIQVVKSGSRGTLDEEGPKEQSSISLQSTAEPQEMDMVEQLYGDLHQPQADPLPKSPFIDNRSADEEAWRQHHAELLISNGAHEPSRLPVANGTSSAAPAHRKMVTLDEYADRMRMAAVMLAQLNANEQTPVGMVQNATGVAGGLVGAGLGLGVGITGAVGAGVDAVRGRLPFGGGKQLAIAGQGSSGLKAELDTSTAVSESSFAIAATSSLQHPSNVSVTPRARILSPLEVTAIKDRIMSEMMALEEERMNRMRTRASGWETNGTPPQRSSEGYADESLVRKAINKEDPSGAVFRESWTEKRSRIRASSPYGHLAGWDLLSVIVKTGTDLRQEQLATQIIREFGKIWAENQCPYWIRL